MLVAVGFLIPVGSLALWSPPTFAFAINLFGTLLGLIINALGYSLTEKLVKREPKIGTVKL